MTSTWQTHPWVTEGSGRIRFSVEGDRSQIGLTSSSSSSALRRLASTPTGYLTIQFVCQDAGQRWLVSPRSRVPCAWACSSVVCFTVAPRNSHAWPRMLTG